MSARAIVVNVLVILIIVGGGAAATYYYNESQNYVRTDNAQVTGQAVSIAPSAGGVLVDWTGKVGETYRAGHTLGHLNSATGRIAVTMPIDSTIVQQTAVPHTVVAPGAPLARAFNLNNLWVTASIDETDINRIESGQAVDIYIDAFPDTTLTGTVDQVGLATAGTFSLLPVTNANANFTRVTQVIPIIVKVDDYRGLSLVPGMSATVRVHI